MKRRTALVSNSSSTSYILDLRDPEVQKVVAECAKPNKTPQNMGRQTAMCIGLRVAEWAREIVEEDIEYWEESKSRLEGKERWEGHGDKILEWVVKLGEENIVFMRESDEEMGGVLFEDCCPDFYDVRELPKGSPYEILRRKALYEWEWH